eukprot:5310558-Alexandrium_andersonii.AAC.1
MQHFLSFFKHTVVLNGDAFAGIDTEANRKQFHTELLKARGKFDADTFCIRDALPPGKVMERLRDYEAHYTELPEKIKDCFICDISQNSKQRGGRCGRLMPTLTKSSFLVSLTKDHIFSPNELDFSQGWPSLDLPGCA